MKKKRKCHSFASRVIRFVRLLDDIECTNNRMSTCIREKYPENNNTQIIKLCMGVRKLRCGKVYRDRSVRAGKVRMT